MESQGPGLKPVRQMERHLYGNYRWLLAPYSLREALTLTGSPETGLWAVEALHTLMAM